MATLTKDQILDGIASLTVLELSELLKEFEEKFGVTAAAPVAVAAVAHIRRHEMEMTVTHAALAGRLVGHGTHGLRGATQDGHFETGIVVEMHVQGRDL